MRQRMKCTSTEGKHKNRKDFASFLNKILNIILGPMDRDWKAM